MHVDEDDVASRVGEGGVRSGKEEEEGVTRRVRSAAIEGAGGDRRRSTAPRLGLERRREDEPLEPNFKRVRTMIGPL